MSVIYSKTITWADATEEAIQITSDGWIILNGEKRRLVGFDLGTTGITAYTYYSESGIALINKELDYMQAAGVRVVTITLAYQGANHEDRYEGILTAAYNHKMLILPLVTNKWSGTAPDYDDAFDNLSDPEFPMYSGGEAMTTFMGRWVDKMIDPTKVYSQAVIALSMENELDYPLNYAPYNQNYDEAAMEAYIQVIEAVADAKTDRPRLYKQLDDDYNAAILLRQNAMLPYTAIPAIDSYQATAELFASKLDDMKAWYIAQGRPESQLFWCLELGTPTGSNFVAADMTKAMIDAAFGAGATVVILMTTNRQQNLSQAFFDAVGDPTENFTTLMAYMSEWQEAIMEHTQNVTLDGGQSEVVSFPITANEKRVHNVSIGDLEGSYEVIPRPASFQLSGLVVSPPILYEGETVDVSVTVTNVGEVQGTYEVILSVD